MQLQCQVRNPRNHRSSWNLSSPYWFVHPERVQDSNVACSMAVTVEGYAQCVAGTLRVSAREDFGSTQSAIQLPTFTFLP